MVEPDRGTATAVEFDVSAIRRRFARSVVPSPAIFWADMLASAAVGWGAFALSLREPPGTALCVAFSLLAIFALLRGVLFIHELAHLKRGALPGFEIAWHVVLGLPLLAPSLMYVGAHTDHHRQRIFGTSADPEYVPLGRWSHARILGFVLAVVFVPAALALRWGVVGPLSHLVPALRRRVVAQASTLVINPDYRRPKPKGRHALRWAVQESAVGATVWAAAALVYAGVLPLGWLAQWYLVTAGVLVVNQIRTLVAHEYTNPGEPVDSLGELLDSINLTGLPPMSAIVAPVGLRYHALHHLLPGLPYHVLGRVHRELCAALPANSPYRSVEQPGVVPALRELWLRSAGATGAARGAAGASTAR